MRARGERERKWNCPPVEFRSSALPCWTSPPVIYEANWIAAAKTKRAARKSSVPRTNTTNAQDLPACPRCQRIFCARIGQGGHLKTQWSNNLTIPTSTSNSAYPPSNSPTLTPGINSTTPTIIETTSQSTSSVASIAVATTTINNGDSLLNGPY
ncbi:unnamed protein product [Schistocephalus solidus]|uniref:C2H2-type domain-containing protein n=1 Tax=Schistocephalus solidus TaxID=70667 RepID=A0A183T5Y6_SCHSO|nr:unnamed protein product [Schistocephalus solidus]